MTFDSKAWGGVVRVAVALAIGAFASQAPAQEKGGDLRFAVQNPISSLISLPFKFTFDYGAENGEASFLSIQPVVPVTVGDWNLVNRVIAPLIDTPGQVTGLPDIPTPIRGDGATGLGDINYSLFLSPVKVGEVIGVSVHRSACRRPPTISSAAANGAPAPPRSP